MGDAAKSDRINVELKVLELVKGWTGAENEEEKHRVQAEYLKVRSDLFAESRGMLVLSLDDLLRVTPPPPPKKSL